MSQPPDGTTRALGRIWLTIVAIGALALVGYYKTAHEPSATAIVRVHSSNGGEVTTGHILIDGQPVGSPGESLHVPAGSVTVGFDEAGWRSDPAKVTLARGEVKTVELIAQELQGHLALSSNPAGATVRILARPVGQTPLSLELAAGAHDVSLALNGYVTQVVSIVLLRGQTSNVNVDLVAAPPPVVAPPRLGPPPFTAGVVPGPTSLMAGPGGNTNVNGTLFAPLTLVEVLARVTTDDTWLQVRANGRVSFVRAGAGVESWDSWVQRNTASGTIEAVTPDLRVRIAGLLYPMAGITVPDQLPSAAGQIRASSGVSERLRGEQAQCVPQTFASFTCKTFARSDIAESMLLSGAAAIGGTSPPSPFYVEAQKTAREKARGLWSE